MICDNFAPDWSGVAVGSFPTTLGRVRRLGPLRATPDRWQGLPDETAAIVCYIDGSVPKAPPGGPPYDRAVIAVVGGRADLVLAGYRSRMPVETP
jgi:hypothetical protein